MNKDLESFSECLRIYKLKLNGTKIKYKIIRRSSLEVGAGNEICISDEPIEEVTSK
jgi:hypothetical protein